MVASIRHNYCLTVSRAENVFYKITYAEVEEGANECFLSLPATIPAVVIYVSVTTGCHRLHSFFRTRTALKVKIGHELQKSCDIRYSAHKSKNDNVTNIIIVFSTVVIL